MSSTIGRTSFLHPGEEKAFVGGLGGGASCRLFHIPSSGVTQTVIEWAGCDSQNITTFSHFNLFGSSWTFQTHSIWYFLLQSFFSLQLPSILIPHPPQYLVLHLVYLFTLKRKGIYCSIHIKWSSCKEINCLFLYNHRSLCRNQASNSRGRSSQCFLLKQSSFLKKTNKTNPKTPKSVSSHNCSWFPV